MSNGQLLIIEHLKKRFGSNLVLKDINLSVDKGQVLAVIGQSGHGKSVILKHIMGLMIPDGGSIVFNGDVISSPEKKPTDFEGVRKHFGMLFQGAALFDSMNVGENIAFPLREHTDFSEEEIARIIADGLEMVGLHGIEDVMPAELSGGMRSRVGLARAVAMKPDVMLYDEPTSALDPIMSDKINDLILDLKHKLGMTSIVVTHDMASAHKVSDKMAMIHDGKIIFQGTPAEIRASKNPYIQQFITGQRKLRHVPGEEPSRVVEAGEGAERRRYRRGYAKGAVVAAIPGRPEPVKASMMDIGGGGLRLFAPVAIDPGTTITIEIPLWEGIRIGDIDADVLSSVSKSAGYWEVRARFSRITPQNREQIIQFVDSLT